MGASRIFSRGAQCGGLKDGSSLVGSMGRTSVAKPPEANDIFSK